MASILELPPCEALQSTADLESQTERGLDVSIDLRRVVAALLCVVAVMITMGTAASIVKYHVAPSTEHKLAKLMNRFDLGFEPSIPNWYSSCALLASCGLLSLISLAKWRARDKYRWHWAVLALVFLGLSIDEGVRIHEMVHTAMVSSTITEDLLPNPWAVPALIFVAIVGLCYVPFLWHVDRRTVVTFVCAAVIYVGGAVGVDGIGNVMIDRYGIESFSQIFAEAGEESLEMLGIVLFNYALLVYIGKCVGPIRLQVQAPQVAH